MRRVIFCTPFYPSAPLINHLTLSLGQSDADIHWKSLEKLLGILEMLENIPSRLEIRVTRRCFRSNQFVTNASLRDVVATVDVTPTNITISSLFQFHFIYKLSFINFEKT